VSSLVQDVRQALRLLGRNPGFAAAALLTIALGVGGTAAVFSVVYGVLLRPLPYPDPDRIVTVAEEHPGATTAFGGVLFTNLTYNAWEPGARTVEAIGAYSNRPATLTGFEEPERIRGTGVTPSLFRILRLAPAAGRLFLDEDAREGAAPVVVLAHAFWRNRFGGDLSALGRTMMLDGQAHEIVGVAPPGFEFPGPNPVDFYGVYRVPRPEAGSGSVSIMRALARLAPGATPEAAAAEATAVARSLERPMATRLLFGEGGPVEVRVGRLLDSMTGRIRPALLLLAAGIVVVLLIACANVANLFLSRSAARSRELAVRAALGAGRRRLLRQLLTESLVISLAGGALGIFTGWALTSAVPAFAPQGFPRLDDVRVDGWFLGAAFLVSTFVGLAAGAIPAFRGSAWALLPAMREGDARATAGQGRVARALLLAGEAALAVMLLVGAVLLARSFTALVRVDAGYDAGHVLVGTLYFSGAARQAGYGPAAVDRILTRVRAHPGAAAAGVSNMAPFSGVTAISGFTIPGQTGPDGQPVVARALSNTITPGYAEALGMQLRAGRFFGAGDGTSGTKPLIVNDAFVRTYLSDGRPVVGRRYQGLLRFDSVEIVGVVGDVLQGQLDAKPEPQIYFPQAPDAQTFQLTIAVRTAGDPSAFAPLLRSLVREADGAVALDAVGPLGARVADSVSQPRFAASVLGAFAVLAALLAATGLYGVLSYHVSQRRRELGVRAALGADRGRLMRLVLRQGLVVTGAGLVVGLAGAAAGTRLMGRLLFGVTPLDAISFAAAPALLGLVALAACLVPALRAAAVDPAEALKAE
jgi:predicted permease